MRRCDMEDARPVPMASAITGSSTVHRSGTNPAALAGSLAVKVTGLILGPRNTLVQKGH